MALAGCRNPFRPAEPEPPASQSQNTVYVDYATPQGVWATVVEAVIAKAQGNGPSAYIGAFADTATQDYGFHVDFDPQVVQERDQAGKSVPVWTRDLEKTFYVYLTGLRNPQTALPYGEYSMGWVPDAPDEVDETAGVATLRFKYTLTATDDGTQIGLGHAELTLRYLSSASRWVITRWVDRLDQTVDGGPTDTGHLSFSRLRIDSTGQ